MTTDATHATDGTEHASIEVPPAIGERLQTAFGFDHRPETFGEWWTALVETFEDGLERSLDAGDLCDVDESPHSATVGGETTHYMCAQDPLVVGLLADEPVTVRSEPPTGDGPVTVRFEDGGIDADPADSVLSFGVDETVEPLERPLGPEDVYGLVCPHGHAFPDREAYDRWAAEADAVTTPLSMEAGIGVMATMIEVAGVEGLD